jgi:hypothetical protein
MRAETSAMPPRKRQESRPRASGGLVDPHGRFTGGPRSHNAWAGWRSSATPQAAGEPAARRHPPARYATLCVGDIAEVPILPEEAHAPPVHMINADRYA